MFTFKLALYRTSLHNGDPSELVNMSAKPMRIIYPKIVTTVP